MSMAEFYGWTYQPLNGNQVKLQCTACGAQLNDQRESVMYECERCMNSHAE